MGHNFCSYGACIPRWQTDRTSNQINTNIRNYIPPRKQRNRIKKKKKFQTNVIRKDFFKEATFIFNLFSKHKSEGVFENLICTMSLLHRTLQLLSMSLTKPRGPIMVQSFMIWFSNTSLTSFLITFYSTCCTACVLSHVPTLCDPRDCSPSASSVHVIL